jgi:predicted secreted protein with PEFG-CTERM motif
VLQFKIKVILLIISLIIIPISSSPSFAQSGVIIQISTEKTAYSQGEIIKISGVVTPYIPGTYVTFQIISPMNNIVEVGQLEINSYTGTFYTDIQSALSWKQGSYEIRGFYDDYANTMIQFDYGITSVGVQETQLDPDEPIEQTTERVDVEEGENLFLEVEGINLNYTISGGKIISITPDVDEKSLIIKIETTNYGELTITLPSDVITPFDDGSFFVLVDGEESDDATQNGNKVTIPLEAGVESIEIIGTHVVPEFGTITAIVLAVAIIAIIGVTAKSRLSIMPKL